MWICFSYNYLFNLLFYYFSLSFYLEMASNDVEKFYRFIPFDLKSI